MKMIYLRILFMSLLVLFVEQVAGYHHVTGSESTAKDAGETSPAFTLATGQTRLWIRSGASIQNVKTVIMSRATDATGTVLMPEFLDQITTTMTETLEKSGIKVLPARTPQSRNAIGLDVIITKFNPGSAGARWLAPGMGATVCIIRATLTDLDTARVLGEIVAWRHLAAGGLFSVGADQYVPRQTAESVANKLIAEIGGVK